jgi:hypothetical protein
MEPDEHSAMGSNSPRLTLEYAIRQPARPWWHGSAWDWLGSIALVLAAFVVTALVLVGLTVFLSYAMYL